MVSFENIYSEILKMKGTEIKSITYIYNVLFLNILFSHSAICV